MKKPIDVVIVGAGSRGRLVYAPFAKKRPDLMRVVGVAEPDPSRRGLLADDYGIPPEMCFTDAETFFSHPRMADAVVIATQDRQHYGHAMAALEKGYHILLEKPVSASPAECQQIADTARERGLHVVVCHVLRYTMFYQLVKFYLQSGRRGDIVSVQQTENVGWWHQAHSFVRGNWRNSQQTSPMILQKSCHDMDILHWLIGKKAVRISSFGSNMHFRPECAPPGAAMRCLDGCQARAGCPYDAEKIYIYSDYTSAWRNDFPQAALCDKVDPAALHEAIRTGPYGRCVYHCDNDVVDHQIVNIEFTGGTTASFVMCGHTDDKVGREITVFGTLGELRADMGSNELTINVFGQPTRVVDVRRYTDDFSGHAGGDDKMMEEFAALVSGEDVLHSTTTGIDSSIHSHLMAMAAEKSRLQNGRVVEIDDV